jgi:phage terminase small subunit
MGRHNVFRLGRSNAQEVPEHFRPEERQAWDDIVATMAPLHLMDEVDRYVLECAAATLASFRSYAPYLDDVARARHAKVLGEILEEALVPISAIPGLVKL